MRRYLLACSIAIGILFLNGCGGGDDSSNQPGPVSPTTSFPLQKAFQLRIANGHSETFLISNGCTGKGSSSSNPANEPSVFEGKSGFSANNTVRMEFSSGCQTTSQTATYYYDSNLIPIGLISSPTIKYGVYLTPPNIPTSVSVGSTGTFGTLTHYTSSAKLTRDGKTIQSYFVESDTASTALVNVMTRMYTEQGIMRASEQTRFRISSLGILTPVDSDVLYENGPHITIKYDNVTPALKPISIYNSYTYLSQGGLIWSSPTGEMYTYWTSVDGSRMALIQCGGALQGDGSNRDFVNPPGVSAKDGWRLPTPEELQRLYNEMPRPQGWAIGPVWDADGRGFDFSTGRSFGRIVSKALVSCVKKV